MAYGFNNNKTKAFVPGFFGGRLLNDNTAATMEGVSTYTFQNDCFAEIMIPDGSGGNIRVDLSPPGAGTHDWYSLFSTLKDGGTSNSYARNLSPFPVKAGTRLKTSSGLVFIFEHEIIY